MSYDNINKCEIEEELNLYELLEIDMESSEQEIKKAWKKLALKYHPDKNQNKNTNEKFLKISNAYEILSNSESKKKYDNELKFKNKFNMNFSNGFNLFDLLDINFKTHLNNFIDSSEIEKIINLILSKNISGDFFDITNGFCKNFDEFIKKLLNVEIVVNFDLKEVWNCEPKIIKYQRHTQNFNNNTCTNNIFEESIYPIDFVQVYENEGEHITINDSVYHGDIIVKINIINTFVNGENYFIYEDELYVLIDGKRIINNRFTLNFLDGNKYKFNITKLNKITNGLGNLYVKKKFGLPKFETNHNENIDDTIRYSNLFFIILLY